MMRFSPRRGHRIRRTAAMAAGVEPTGSILLVWTQRRRVEESLMIGGSASHVERGNEPGGRPRASVPDSSDMGATQPQFVYRQRMRLGDLLIWDNHGHLASRGALSARTAVRHHGIGRP
jgi:hypothetical protein